MEKDASRVRPRSQRQPLCDASNRANIAPVSVCQSRYDSATLSSEKQMKSPDPTDPQSDPNYPAIIAENKRLSAVIDSHTDSKRNSAISTTSADSGRSRRKTHIGPWQLGRTLGKGSTGRVRLAKHAITGQSAAVKIVSKKSAALAQSQSIAAMDKNICAAPGSRAIPSGIEREVVIMKLIEHPNVISLYDVWENRGELYLVLEYVKGGELFDYVSERGALPEIEAPPLRFARNHQWIQIPRPIRLIFGVAEIILFAMLAGFLPFDGGDLQSTLKLVKKGEYILPPWFSPEAVDLVQRILQKKPENRIRMDQMWLHPLLAKYQSHPVIADSPIESIGPPPPLPSKDFKKIRREELIEMLLNDGANHEKLFYKALLKFRDEQLENYEGPPLEYSSSDYHHVSRPMFRPYRRMSSNHGENNMWKRSKFSIATNTSGLRESSSRVPSSARTIASYDPYRSSRTAIADPKVEYANVTIHRHFSTDSDPALGSRLSPAIGESTGVPTSFNMPSSSNDGPWSSSRRSSLASFQSRSSIGSYRQRVKSGYGYKKNVSFRHLQSHAPSKRRRRVEAPRLQSQYSLCEGKPKLPSHQTERAKRLSTDRFSSPSLPSPPTCVRQAKNRVGELELGAKSRQSYQYWKEEARKVSQELEQICEEAFNSSSLSSSRTIETGTRYPESPVTSISTPGNLNSYYARKNLVPVQEESLESSSSYATRELAETRRRLIEHSNQASADGLPSYLSEVIAHLDRLIANKSSAKTTNVTTAVAEQTQTSYNSKEKLQSISEERHIVKNFLSGESDASYSPIPLTLNDWGKRKTIRAVPDSTNNLGTIKPLTIRKKRTTLEFPVHPIDAPSPEEQQRSSSESIARNRSVPRRTTGRFYSGLEPIEENPRSPKKIEARNSGESRKWSWFKPNPQNCESAGPSRPPKDVYVSSRQSSISSMVNHSSQSVGDTPAIEDNNLNWFKKSGPTEKGKRLLKFFGRKKHDRPALELGQEVNDSDFAVSLGSKDESDNSDTSNPADSTSTRLSYTNSPTLPASSQNWFVKFFHIKPATRTIALNTSKSRARREVLKILREWRKYGMEDIYFDKQNSLIRGKVAELNFLRLRPVEFSAELFTVLEYGRHVSLSLMRLKQERGAASSFRKVVETLSVVLQQRKLLVEDSGKAKKMAKVLNLTVQ
ncbi:conserved hypothetical protein [Uncinocarpus reesii 1704]|uniref:non-specific serine/threonine protein kinase n=1 Tax=Uncinocarpus reesii (strain UAMH 1704) TaxID=336963 RepID=C4JPB2_UNCRE|nr:uncharacterized protein UREG_04494 [Uncinocarpus reesii 1704]EEP79648.1 conserved hypothetical protein [Uncinocarpus reesii 1704]